MKEKIILKEKKKKAQNQELSPLKSLSPLFYKENVHPRLLSYQTFS